MLALLLLKLALHSSRRVPDQHLHRAVLLPIMIVVLTAYFITSISDSFKALAFALLIWGPITCGTLFVRLLGRA